MTTLTTTRSHHPPPRRPQTTMAADRDEEPQPSLAKHRFVFPAFLSLKYTNCTAKAEYPYDIANLHLDLLSLLLQSKRGFKVGLEVVGLVLLHDPKCVVRSRFLSLPTALPSKSSLSAGLWKVRLAIVDTVSILSGYSYIPCYCKIDYYKRVIHMRHGSPSFATADSILGHPAG
jgi:hypothetical protein